MNAARATIITVAAIALVAFTATPASAHDKSASVDCESATVSLTNYDRNATATVTLDGTVLHEGTFGGRLVATYPTAGNQEHAFTVHVVSQDGTRYNFDYSESTAGCYVPPVVPEKPADRVSSEETTSLDCATSVATRTVTTTTIGTELIDNVWVDLAPVVTVEDFPREVTAVECPPASTPDPTVPPVAPESPDRLATTGPSDAVPALVGATALLAAGLLLLIRRRRNTPRHRLVDARVEDSDFTIYGRQF